MNQKTHQRYVILGAGPTGLGAALRLKELGCNHFHVYEMAAHVGGLAWSDKDAAGFTWDIGGHVLFSHYPYFDTLMKHALGDAWVSHERESWIWIENRFVPYPFQNNLRHLSAATRWKCLKGLIEVYKERAGTSPLHFGEWIEKTFGKGVAEVFMRPYNFKVWAYPPEEMDFRWVGERVAVADLERVVDNILHEKDDLSWGPNNVFQFPLHGGNGAIWESVADLVGREHITLNAEVIKIDPQGKEITFRNGSRVKYDVLISTLPIDRLVVMAGLNHLAPYTQQLKHSSTHVIGVGLTGKPPAKLASKCWMYFPEDDSPFYRATVFSNYSPNNVPDIREYWSLMVEVSESPVKPVDGRLVVQEAIAGMKATCLMNDTHEIVTTFHYRAEYGYPTPTPGRDEALNAVHPELEKLAIYSRGRFGGWKYEVSNQDHSLMQGVELANRLVIGDPELTYWFPNEANRVSHSTVAKK